MAREFDPNAWCTLVEALRGLAIGGASSSSCSGAPLLPKGERPKLRNLEQISEHVFELSENPEIPSAEIIFFHGLQLESSNEPCITTWSSKDHPRIIQGSSKDGTELWLNQILEEFPDVRILVVSYDASIIQTDDPGRLDMHLICENPVQELMKGRKGRVGEKGCPMILVGHSVQDLVMKEICVQVARLMTRRQDGGFKHVFQGINEVSCYSTPHRGSNLPDCTEASKRGSLLRYRDTLNARTARRNEELEKLRLAEERKSEEQLARLMAYRHDESSKHFFQSVKAFFCYSTSHRGSKLPDGTSSSERGSLFKYCETLNARTARRNEDFRKLRLAAEKRISERVGQPDFFPLSYG